MKRMVRTAQGDVVPRAGLDPLGLMDVAKAVSEAGFRVSYTPSKQGRRHRQEQRDGGAVLQTRAPVPSVCESRDPGQGSIP